ncbi:MAG: HNH endonuclease [Muribaculaceae bacterium]|nr:HNH endonuclease [Muribaculaceae bacterium]
MTQPLCEVCETEGKTTPGEHVHHLITFVGAPTAVERDRLAYDEENLMTVCSRCHARIHGGDLQGCQSKEEICKRIMHK